MSRGQVGSESYKKFREFVDGLKELGNNPGKIIDDAWEKFKLESKAIEGPFSTGRKVEFWTRHIIKFLANLIFFAKQAKNLAKNLAKKVSPSKGTKNPKPAKPVTPSTGKGPTKSPDRAKPGPLKQNTADLVKLYDDAAVANKELREITGKFAEETGGKPVYRDGLKKTDAAMEKVKGEYGGDGSRLIDIAASTVTYDSIAQIRRALSILQGNHDVVNIKDILTAAKPNGFRNIRVNLRMKNGHIVEMQLHLGVIFEAGKREHEIYEIIRSIKRAAQAEGRFLTKDELAKVNFLETESKALLKQAWEKSLHRASWIRKSARISCRLLK